MLSREQKEVAKKAFNTRAVSTCHATLQGVYAAVEAVLAMQATGEGEAVALLKEDRQMHLISGCCIDYDVCREDKRCSWCRRVDEYFRAHPSAPESQPASPAPKKRSLSDVCEELCPGVRKRNWPAWAGSYREEGQAPLPDPKMTQDEDDDVPASPAECICPSCNDLEGISVRSGCPIHGTAVASPAGAENKLKAIWEWYVCWEPETQDEEGFECSTGWVVAVCDKTAGSPHEFTGDTKEAAVQAALEFTQARQEQARQIEDVLEEVEYLKSTGIAAGAPEPWELISKLLERELATATRGFRR